MQEIITALYNYICENTPPIRNDPDYQRALQEYREVEEELKEKIGEDLLEKYQCAEADVSHRQDIAVFVQSLRLGTRFMLEVLR